MNSNRRFAVAAGVLWITATVADVISRAVLVQPILGAPDYLTRISANEGQILLGALFLLVGAVAAAGIAIALYPVLRQQDEALALGSVGFRLIEGAFYLGIVVCLLILVTVSRESANAGTPASSIYEAPAALVMAARDALSQVSVLIFGLGALMYYWVFYRSRLVPRWLSAWGLVAIISVMLSMLLVMFGLVELFSPPQLVLAFPILVQEMVMAVWLITKGFNPRAVSSAPAIATAPASATSLAGAQTL
jgi:magnesium-transporting ATPase (P-type)